MIETLKSNNLTVVGTVMPNRKHLPVELTEKAGHLVGFRLFAFKDDLTMCSCVPKKEQARPFVINCSSVWQFC